MGYNYFIQNLMEKKKMENKDCKHEILNYEFKIDKMTNISCAECGENDKSKLPVGAKVIRNSVFDTSLRGI